MGNVEESARFTGWAVIDRWLLRGARVRDEVLVAELARGGVGRPGWSWSRGVVTVMAVLIQVASIGSLVVGGWLATRHFPGVGLLAGIVLIAFGALLLPRPAGLPRYATRLRRGDAPHLFAFVAGVAAKVGVRCPDLIVVDDSFTADAGAAGLRRRRYLRLGVPMLATLDTPQRTALVAHQLAHFTSGDPLRGPLVGSVDRSFGALVDLFTPHRDTVLRAWQDPEIIGARVGIGAGGNASSTLAIVWYTELLLRPVLAVLQAAAVLGRLALAVLVKPDVHRAEYHADAVAARVAGPAAVRELFDVMVLRESVLTVLRRQVRTGGDGPDPAAWRAAARQVRLDAAATLPQLYAADLTRSTSPFADHPPLLHRARLQTPTEADTQANTEADTRADAVDADLAGEYRRLIRDLRYG